MELISTILSVYNDADFVSLTIESILNQSFNNLELIVINDGSTDSSGKIIDQYANEDNRIKVVHQKNMGLTKSLNKALKMAKGEYIARQDSGDISDPERFKKQIQFLKNNKDISVCFTWANIIGLRDEKISEFVFPVSLKKMKKKLEKNKNIYVHGSAMFKKSDIMDIGGYNEEMVVSQDFDMWLRLIKHGYKLGCISEHLYDWRYMPDSISVSRTDDQLLYSMKALQDYNEKFQNKPIGKPSGCPDLHFMANLLFRAQNRGKMYKNSCQLLKNKELTINELVKTVLALQPIPYKWMFKYF